MQICDQPVSCVGEVITSRSTQVPREWIYRKQSEDLSLIVHACWELTWQVRARWRPWFYNSWPETDGDVTQVTPIFVYILTKKKSQEDVHTSLIIAVLKTLLYDY